MNNLVTLDISITSSDEALALFGNQDAFLKILENELKVEIITRGEQIQIYGTSSSLKKANAIFSKLLQLIKLGQTITSKEIYYAIDLEEQNKLHLMPQMLSEEITKNARAKAIYAKTIGQKKYVTEIKSSDLVFAIGPAGTGKTYLAVALAVVALKNNEIKKIILTRPAIEAGEQLGFLPGDLKEKVDPYLRPLYDALHDILGVEHTERLMERETIEIAPLAYMRGRTLDDAYIILDEAQNTTEAQMKMFLTRLGYGSKMIITGDKTQLDLPKGANSGLFEAEKILTNISGISFSYLDEADIVRHPLVKKIINAYAKST